MVTGERVFCSHGRPSPGNTGNLLVGIGGNRGIDFGYAVELHVKYRICLRAVVHHTLAVDPSTSPIFAPFSAVSNPLRR